MRTFPLVCVALLALSCMLTAGCGGGGGAQVAAPGPVSNVEEKPDVPVFIEAYYPLNEGHQFIADYLEAVETANPDTIAVRFHDMQSAEGRKKWATTGLSCAGVFVNGSTRHEIDREGETETVDFLQRMDVFWTRDDFETVLKQELEKVSKAFVAPPRETEAEDAAEPADASGETSVGKEGQEAESSS